MTTSDGPHELQRHLEGQMRAQERQLVWVRLGMVAVAAAFVLAFGANVPGLPVLLGVLAVVAVLGLLTPLLLRRFPAREVGIVSTAVDMAAVTVAIYVAPGALDIYLFYGLVILGAALRFGLGAAIWSSLVMSALYTAVIVATDPTAAAVRELLPIRVAYLVGIGFASGLFSRIVIGRASENARLQQRLAEEERDRERRRADELLSRLGRDFAASLERDDVHRAIVDGAGPLLGTATAVFGIDDGERRLVAEAASGPDEALAEAWLAAARRRPVRIGEGVTGAVAATAAARVATRDEIATGDPDGMRELGVDWMLAVPMLAGGRLLGVLATVGAGERPAEPLSRLAEAIAERAGPALENARLWADLQERMRHEQAAQRIKDDFLSIVSHELRTPLTSIQGYSQLLESRLRSEHAGESKEMAHLRVIRSQVGRMRRLVDDLLDVSRIDRRGGVSIEPVDFDLAQEARDAVGRSQREHADRQIEIEAPDSAPVHADRDRLDQVLTNLLENAVKYSPDGGPIRLTVERRGGEVEVRVTDAGVGIPEEHRDHVFERFYQADGDAGRRRFGGLGLGLYISRAIIDAHGGRIWAAANPDGQGSVFGFRIPRVAMPVVPREVAPTGEPPPFVVRRRDD
jgi:signal transduction histidine kinase